MGLGLMAGLSSLGSFLGSSAGQGALAVGSMASSAAGGLFAGIKNKKQHKRNQEIINLQNKLELERMEQANKYIQENAAIGQQYAMDMFNHQFQTQSEWNEKMLNEQREYDSPQATMERMRQAGMNPALALAGGANGGGGASANVTNADASGAAHVGAPTAIAPQGIGMALQAESITAQTNLIKQQTQAQRIENIKKSTTEIPREVADITLKKSITNLNKQTEELRKSETSLNVKKIEEIDVSISKIEEEIGLIAVNKEIAEETKLAQIDKAWQESTNAYYTGLEKIGNIKIKEETLKEIKERTSLLAYRAYSERLHAEASMKSAEADQDKATASIWQAEIYQEYVNAYANDVKSLIETRGKQLSIEEEKLLKEWIKLGIDSTFEIIDKIIDVLPSNKVAEMVKQVFNGKGEIKSTERTIKRERRPLK